MEKLMKPSEYAKELGISRQAIYAKIKRGILKSKTVDGKLYIVVENTTQKKTIKTPESKKTQPTTKKTLQKDIGYEELLKAKDETIGVLKETIQDLKESNKEISTTLRGEIDLLKDAFYEMRRMYTEQISYKPDDSLETEAIELEEENIEFDEKTMVSVKKFCKLYGIKEKKVDKIKKVIKKLYKNGDSRFDVIDGKLKVDINQIFDDILE